MRTQACSGTRGARLGVDGGGDGGGVQAQVAPDVAARAQPAAQQQRRRVQRARGADHDRRAHAQRVLAAAVQVRAGRRQRPGGHAGGRQAPRAARLALRQHVLCKHACARRRHRSGRASEAAARAPRQGRRALPGRSECCEASGADSVPAARGMQAVQAGSGACGAA